MTFKAIINLSDFWPDETDVVGTWELPNYSGGGAWYAYLYPPSTQYYVMWYPDYDGEQSYCVVYLYHEEYMPRYIMQEYGPIGAREFTNEYGTVCIEGPPGKPRNPDPDNAAEDIRLRYPTLTWESGGG